MWKRKETLKADVLAWMDAEAKALRLRSNGDAPMWLEYEAAEKALADGLARVWGVS